MADKKRPRQESSESPEVKRMRETLVRILYEDDDDDNDGAAFGQELDRFIKSLEDEIRPSQAKVKSDSDELGFLLKASDEELGLPPLPPPTSFQYELGRVQPGPFPELHTYDMFGFGVGDGDGRVLGGYSGGRFWLPPFV